MRAALRKRIAAMIRKRQGEDTLPLTLARRRLYILPTRAGLGFGLLLLLMLVAGLNYANSLALFLTFLLTGFTLVTMHHCHRNLLGAQLVAANAPPTFAQRDGTLSLTFENSSANARYQIAAGVGDAPTIPADVPANGFGRVDVPVPALKTRNRAHRPAAPGHDPPVRAVPCVDLGACADRDARVSAARMARCPCRQTSATSQVSDR